MEKVTSVYLRDGVEMAHDEWWTCLNDDIDAVQTRHNFYIKNAVYGDVLNGRESVVNQHVYLMRSVDK